MSRATTSRGIHIARGSTGTRAASLRSAANRALDAHARVRRKAEQLSEELDDITSPHGIPTTDLDTEDSMVIAVDRVRMAAKAG